jgi:hypothetical protein
MHLPRCDSTRALLVGLVLTGAAVLPAQAAAPAAVVRPGPALLYAPPAVAPQLQNTGPWKADPLLVSGAEAYRGGEFLYQDYLYDDHGAAGNPDPADPFTGVANLFSPKRGTLTYPTNQPLYANNNADLVEFRVRPVAGGTAFRATLNTMTDPQVTAFTVALGSSSTVRSWPFGAGVSSPASQFLTVHGSSAVLTDAATGRILAPAPTVTVDTVRSQVSAVVPTAAWDPGHTVVRMAMGTGLWDTTASRFLAPAATATATQPGGAAANGAALFNVAFRTHERVPAIYAPGIANTIAEGGALVRQDGSWWRERDQADQLASGDLSQFAAQVDFGKLAAGTNDQSGVPSAGDLDRIYAGHVAPGKGVNYSVMCLTGASNCTGRHLGQLQPYALYVPAKPLPATGFGLVVSMHGLSANYNEFLGSHEAEQLAERGTGSIVASPEGRGPDGSWQSYAEADVFDMWNDIARHYRLDRSRTDVTGYSMGGGGTYGLASKWPDLWARAFPIVGPPTVAGTFLNLRNIPVLAWYGQTDELVGPQSSEQAFLDAQQAGIRYDHVVFTPAGHITEGNNDQFAPAAAFLGDAVVDRNPAHITFGYDLSRDNPQTGHADHAYWLSHITPRTAGSVATVDVRSLSRGHGDPAILPVRLGAGVLQGGSHGPLPYTERILAWGPTPKEQPKNELIVHATNVQAVTIDPARAGVTCRAKLTVVSDGPLTVTLLGCR